MPKVSKQTAAQVDDFGVAEDRHEDLDGYTVNFVSIRQSHDLAPMLEALPGGNCPCPHWGYLVKGRLIVRYGDHEEVIEAATPSTCRRDTRPQRKREPGSSSSARPRIWRPLPMPSRRPCPVAKSFASSSERALGGTLSQSLLPPEAIGRACRMRTRPWARERLTGQPCRSRLLAPMAVYSRSLGRLAGNKGDVELLAVLRAFLRYGRLGAEPH